MLSCLILLVAFLILAPLFKALVDFLDEIANVLSGRG